MTEPIRRAHVDQVLPRNQFLVVGPVTVSALREGRWVDGELGLTEEWLVFASGDPHDVPDLALLDTGIEMDASTDAGVTIVTIEISRTVRRYRGASTDLEPLLTAITRLREAPPSGERVWREGG
jgi:hypothetical protein